MTEDEPQDLLELLNRQLEGNEKPLECEICENSQQLHRMENADLENFPQYLLLALNRFGNKGKTLYKLDDPIVITLFFK